MAPKKLIPTLTAIVFVCIIGISGCNSSSDSDSDTSTDVSLLTGYGEDVKACTPYLEPTGSSEGLDEADSVLGEDIDIADWSGWDPEVEYTVLYKLFNPDSGVEGIFAPIEQADMFIEVINSLQEYWNADGEYDGIELTNDDSTGTVTIDTTVTEVTVPFFGVTQSVDRMLTITGETTDMGSMSVRIAFTTNDGDESLVVYHEFPEYGEIGVFYGQRSADGTMDIQSACYTDDFSGAFRWRGNPDEGIFALSQYTNSADDSWILAGGEAAGEMAFLARRGDSNDGTPYYIVCTMENIEDGIEPEDGAVKDATVDVPDPETQAVLGYIVDGNDLCLGYLTAYPQSADDIAWVD